MIYPLSKANVLYSYRGILTYIYPRAYKVPGGYNENIVAPLLIFVKKPLLLGKWLRGNLIQMLLKNSKLSL